MAYPMYNAYQPIYPSYNQQQYQPYQQMIQQPAYQPPAQQPTANTISGRFVNSVNDVTANDVPMDGKPAIFPSSNLSEIAVKRWNGNGQIETIIFKPQGGAQSVASGNTGNLTSEFTDALQGVLEHVDERFDKLEKTIKPARTRKDDGA